MTHGIHIWGKDLNLHLCWLQKKYPIKDDTFWFSSKALLWSLEPCRLLASILLSSNEYSIRTEGLYGLTEHERIETEKHLASLGLTKRLKDGWLQD